MKSKIKNIHNESISLFVKIDGVEKHVSIPAGESMIIDTYDTKTIRVFRQRGFITMEKFITITDNTVQANLNNETANGYLHMTETIEDIVLDENMKYLQENLIKSLTKEDNFKKFEEDSESEKDEELDIVVSGDLDRLDVVEGEVEKYIEGGYIKGEWTDEDIEFLKKNYPTKGRKFCSTHLNRNESSVQKKINALDLKKKKKRK